jgi:hypothetical protein
MGLYDFLIKYNIDYDTLVKAIYDLSSVVYIDTELIIPVLDSIYDDDEFQELKTEGAKNENKLV